MPASFYDTDIGLVIPSAGVLCANHILLNTGSLAAVASERASTSGLRRTLRQRPCIAS
jgi:hypothetical protein